METLLKCEQVLEKLDLQVKSVSKNASVRFESVEHIVIVVNHSHYDSVFIE